MTGDPWILLVRIIFLVLFFRGFCGRLVVGWLHCFGDRFGDSRVGRVFHVIIL